MVTNSPDYAKKYMAKKRQDPEYVKREKEYLAKYRARNLEHMRAQEREYARKTKLAKFNMTLDDYNRMLARQNGVCAICLQSPNGRKQSLCLDHDHATNKVRGLLCRSCNAGIGLLKEHPEYIRRCLTYLRVM